ncbi:MAG: hypothetical protein D3904_01745, partial [Candidatus Electrothrix sp. EH2]|nr:hypothetical protein [Candidatus Electrothrix sp. EH2]
MLNYFCLPTYQTRIFAMNKAVFVILLFASELFLGRISDPGQDAGRVMLSAPAVYGAESPAQQHRSAKVLSTAVHQLMAQQMSRMQESGTMNSSTCGRPWKRPLAEIQGRIRKVEYRIQPFTKRRGLHIDVETGPRSYTVVVYPQRLTARCPSVFHFTEGETVKVSGSEFFTGPGGMRQNICAAVIAQKKDILNIRDVQSGEFDRLLCCRKICEKNCIGLPPLCGRMCIMNCGNRTL